MRPLFRPLAATLLLSALIAMFCARAHAQDVRFQPRLAAELALSLEAVAAVPPPMSSSHEKDVRRAHNLTAAGVGLLLSGLAGIAVGLSSGPCSDGRILIGPTSAGAVLLGGGIAFLIGGTRRLNHLPKTERRGSRAWPILVGIGTALLGTATVAASSVAEFAVCSSS